jgi:hypothetical protein
MLAMGLAPAAVFLLAGAAIGPFFLAMALLWEERASVRFLRLLRSAPRYQRGDSGFRSLVVSLVRGKLVRERRAARQTMFATRWERWAEREDNRADVFGLLGSTEEGTEVHIHPGDAVFGSTRRSATRENAGVQDVVTVTESIGPGDQVLVLGRPHPKGEGLAVDATGPESLILFGAEGDPRRAATRALGVHFAAVVALLGLAIVGAGLAWLNPYVTRRSLSGDVTSVTGLGTVHVGDPCVVDIAHQDAAEPSLFACQAVITCGGVRLHGGFMRGFFDCDVAGDAWQTPDETSTADPRIRLVPPNHVEVRPREGQVIQILVDR